MMLCGYRMQVTVIFSKGRSVTEAIQGGGLHRFNLKELAIYPVHFWYATATSL
jgi:hypothetical protein